MSDAGWLTGLESTLTVDGNTVVIGDQAIVTSLSFVATITQKRPILAAGLQLRDEKGLPWIVLHHHPPSLHEGIGQEELIAARRIRILLDAYGFSQKDDLFGWIQIRLKTEIGLFESAETNDLTLRQEKIEAGHLALYKRDLRLIGELSGDLRALI